MAGTPPRRRTGFAHADPAELVRQLADVIAELRPHVLVTYDPNGGYGHPDHIQAHRITTAAVDAATDRWRCRSSIGRWRPRRRCARDRRLDADDVLPDWVWPPREVEFGLLTIRSPRSSRPPEQVAAKGCGDGRARHQIAPGRPGRAFTLSNKMILPVLATEHYVLVSGQPGTIDGEGWERDLLAGLDLSE